MSQETPITDVKVATPAPRFAPADVDAKPAEGEAPAALETLKLGQQFEPDDYDEGVDVNALPAPPWTREALGDDLFNRLATLAGAGQIQPGQLGASLDPRSFGRSRAIRLIQKYGLTGDQAQAYLNEGDALQEAIDAHLPPVRGTARNPVAKPLKPAKTTFNESGPKPKTWS